MEVNYLKMMIRLVTIDSAPEIIGRFDRSLLTAQQCMEILVCDFREHFTDVNGNFHDVKHWTGVECHEDSGVVSIEWGRNTSVVGKCIDLQWLPTTLEKFSFSSSDLDGTVNTHELPRGLKNLNLSHNCFKGGLDVSGLPPNTRTVDIQANEFHGNLDLPALPMSITRFMANNNDFSGPIDLSSLPPRLSLLSLQCNSLSGELLLPEFPRRMQLLHLQENKFQQDMLVVGEMPASLRSLMVDGSKFGKIVQQSGKLHMTIPMGKAVLILPPW